MISIIMTGYPSSETGIEEIGKDVKDCILENIPAKRLIT
jgi:hypothetical protein